MECLDDFGFGLGIDCSKSNWVQQNLLISRIDCTGIGHNVHAWLKMYREQVSLEGNVSYHCLEIQSAWAYLELECKYLRGVFFVPCHLIVTEILATQMVLNNTTILSWTSKSVWLTVNLLLCKYMVSTCNLHLENR